MTNVITSNEWTLEEIKAAHEVSAPFQGPPYPSGAVVLENATTAYNICRQHRAILLKTVERLTRENAELRHDLERSMANHIADINPAGLSDKENS